MVDTTHRELYGLSITQIKPWRRPQLHRNSTWRGRTKITSRISDGMLWETTLLRGLERHFCHEKDLLRREGFWGWYPCIPITWLGPTPPNPNAHSPLFFPCPIHIFGQEFMKRLTTANIISGVARIRISEAPIGPFFWEVPKISFDNLINLLYHFFHSGLSISILYSFAITTKSSLK